MHLFQRSKILFLFAILLGLGATYYTTTYAGGQPRQAIGKVVTAHTVSIVESPIGTEQRPSTVAVDREGEALTGSFTARTEKKVSNPGQKISVRLPVLNEFAGKRRPLFLRHLASSAKWLVTREQGKIYAYRRFVVNGRWQDSLNGYYSANTFDMWTDQQYQFRIIIGLNGPVMDQPWRAKATVANISNGSVRLKAIEDKEFEQGIESYLVLRSKGAALEIFEQSLSRQRPFTPLALQQIDRELHSVLSSQIALRRGFDPKLMPPESIKAGKSEIRIQNGMQGGIYSVYAYVNPGEPGYAYLKVFEATKNTPLSTDRVGTASTEYIGWSENPEEQFFYGRGITVYEGDWGTYYPARFELWFAPDSGKPQRKLIEKTFKIEGWQR